MCFSPQRRAILAHQMFEKCSEPHMFCTFSLPNALFATAAYNFSTSDVQKVLPQRRTILRHLNLQKCSEHVIFVHFDFQMCFSPQQRTIFRHLNLQKCSEHVMFCTFSLPNVLFATAAYNFSTSELQKVLRN